MLMTGHAVQPQRGGIGVQDHQKDTHYAKHALIPVLSGRAVAGFQVGQKQRTALSGRRAQRVVVQQRCIVLGERLYISRRGAAERNRARGPRTVAPNRDEGRGHLWPVFLLTGQTSGPGGVRRLMPEWERLRVDKAHGSLARQGLALGRRKTPQETARPCSRTVYRLTSRRTAGVSENGAV